MTRQSERKAIGPTQTRLDLYGSLGLWRLYVPYEFPLTKTSLCASSQSASDRCYRVSARGNTQIDLTHWRHDGFNHRVHSGIRILVIVGAEVSGKKELVGLWDGYGEREQLQNE